MCAGERNIRIGLFNGPELAVRAGDDDHLADGSIGRVEGDPQADQWFGGDVLLVLVQALTTAAGRLEVEHGLAQDRLVVDELFDRSEQIGAGGPSGTGRVPVVHVDHARVGVVGIVGSVVGTAAVARMGALGAQLHVVADHGLGLVGCEHLGHGEVALGAVGLYLGGGEVHGGLLPK